MFRRLSLLTTVVMLAGPLLPAARSWNYAGHRLVNELALAALPEQYPNFVYAVANVERIAFLSGEPDRWRNVPDFPLKQSGGSWTDHFLDVEYLPEAGIDPATVTSFRYDFIVQFAAGRAAHAHHFKPIDPAKNADHTQEWPGFLPWAVAEQFGRLRSAFSYLKVYEDLGTADEVRNAQANIVYLMGVMGHFLGDAAQPLHTTKHYNGWAGENPRDFTRWNGLHSWVDNLASHARLTLAELAPHLGKVDPISLAPRADGRDPLFVAMLDFVLAQNRQVETLYQLEKDGKLGHSGGVLAPEARAFVAERILAGGRMLAAIWLTAQRAAVPDTFLRSALIKRRTTPAATPAGATGAP